MKNKPPWMHPNAEFNMYVGFCITAWAKVEEQLFALCQRSLGTSERQASIVYNRAPSFEARKGLVDELQGDPVCTAVLRPSGSPQSREQRLAICDARSSDGAGLVSHRNGR